MDVLSGPANAQAGQEEFVRAEQRIEVVILCEAVPMSWNVVVRGFEAQGERLFAGEFRGRMSGRRPGRSGWAGAAAGIVPEDGITHRPGMSVGETLLRCQVASQTMSSKPSSGSMPRMLTAGLSMISDLRSGRSSIPAEASNGGIQRALKGGIARFRLDAELGAARAWTARRPSSACLRSSGSAS